MKPLELFLSLGMFFAFSKVAASKTIEFTDLKLLEKSSSGEVLSTGSCSPFSFSIESVDPASERHAKRVQFIEKTMAARVDQVYEISGVTDRYLICEKGRFFFPDAHIFRVKDHLYRIDCFEEGCYARDVLGVMDDSNQSLQAFSYGWLNEDGDKRTSIRFKMSKDNTSYDMTISYEDSYWETFFYIEGRKG